MRISVFGLGYVGCVSAACLARDGFDVVGVDSNAQKVESIRRGEAPIEEPGLTEMVRTGVAAGRIGAMADLRAAVNDTEISVVCVGTPLSPSGALDLTHVLGVMADIGRAVADKGRDHQIVLRSTVPPGTTARCREILDQSGARTLATLIFNPEFLREGLALKDYDAPPFVIIGARADGGEGTVRRLYASVDAPTYIVPWETAELLKFACNAWHATKISFANEVGRIAKAYGTDGRAVMDLMVKDTKLNVSAAYLRPGSAFGGSCLPKDVAALAQMARLAGVSVPLVEATQESNQEQIRQIAAAVLRGQPRKVAVLGLSFKHGTDDLRGSPAVAVVKQLLGEGCEVRVFDPFVRAGRLTGANLAVIRATLPHFEALLYDDPSEALEGAEVALLNHSGGSVSEAVRRLGAGIRIVDAAGYFACRPTGVEYDGIGW